MTPRQGIAVGILLLLFGFLASSVTVYGVRQQTVTREGNRLRSTESIAVQSNAQRILAASSEFSDDLSVYKEVSDDGTVRSVLARDLDRLPLPIHAGRMLRAGEVRTALVGAQVPLARRGEKSFVDIEGRQYEVVGFLGLRATSLLANDVLVSDSELFSRKADEPPGGLLFGSEREPIDAVLVGIRPADLRATVPRR